MGLALCAISFRGRLDMLHALVGRCRLEESHSPIGMCKLDKSNNLEEPDVEEHKVGCMTKSLKG